MFVNLGQCFMDLLLWMISNHKRIAYFHSHANKEVTIYKDVLISRSTTRLLADRLQIVDKTVEW